MTVEYRYATTDQERKACLDIRKQVFILGQDVPEDLEIDGLDESALHVLAGSIDAPIGTARIRIADGRAKIERVAVLDAYQGQGVGFAMMQFILAEMQKRPDVQQAKLGSQTHAIPFYKKLGFAKIGEEYMDANIPHFNMIRDVRE